MGNFGCFFFLLIFLSAMLGSALFVYALFVPGDIPWIAVVCGAVCLVVAFQSMRIMSRAARRAAVQLKSSPLPDARIFPDVDALDFDALSAQLVPIMAVHFRPERLLGRPSVSSALDRLMWPFWFIAVVEHPDDGKFDSLLSAQKEVIDFLCDRLATVGMDDAGRRLQFYRATTPTPTLEARGWFSGELPRLKDLLLQYVREHRDDYQAA